MDWRHLDHDAAGLALLVCHELSRPHLSSPEIAAHCVTVEAGTLELAHDHADMLLAEVLSPVTRNRDHDAGFVAEAPMTRSLAGEFGKAVIDKPGHERSAGDRAHRRIVVRARRKPGPRLTIAFILSAPLSRPSCSLIGTPGPVIKFGRSPRGL